MRRPTILALTGAVALATLPAGSAASPQAGAAFVRDCNHRVDFNLVITSARNMRCRAARREMRLFRGSISFRFRTPNDFLCRRVSGTRLGGQWRCVNGIRAFRFEFGD
jgi:hypothetical protein